MSWKFKNGLYRSDRSIIATAGKGIVEAAPTDATGPGPNAIGGTVMTERSFNAAIEDSWSVRAGDEPNNWFIAYYDESINNYRRLDNNNILSNSVGGVSYVNPPPASPNNVGVMAFNVGQTAGSGPVLISKTISNASGGQEAYVRCRIMFSYGFHNGYNGMSGTSKIFYTELNAGNQCIWGYTGRRRETLRWRLSLQNCMRDTSGTTYDGLNGDGAAGWTLDSTEPSNPSGVDGIINRGIWYDVEYYQKRNTGPTTFDGIWDFWVDGVHLFHRTDIGYAGDDTNNGQPFGSLFNKIKPNPTWTGGTASGTDSSDPDGAVAGTTTLLPAHGPNYIFLDELRMEII